MKVKYLSAKESVRIAPNGRAEVVLNSDINYGFIMPDQELVKKGVILGNAGLITGPAKAMLVNFKDMAVNISEGDVIAMWCENLDPIEMEEVQEEPVVEEPVEEPAADEPTAEEEEKNEEEPAQNEEAGEEINSEDESSDKDEEEAEEEKEEEKVEEAPKKRGGKRK